MFGFPKSDKVWTAHSPHKDAPKIRHHCSLDLHKELAVKKSPEICPRLSSPCYNFPVKILYQGHIRYLISSKLTTYHVHAAHLHSPVQRTNAILQSTQLSTLLPMHTVSQIHAHMHIICCSLHSQAYQRNFAQHTALHAASPMLTVPQVCIPAPSDPSESLLLY